jgi:hypothetical protein
VRTTLGLLAAVIVLVAAAPTQAQTRVSPVDQIIARCPTAAEVAGVQARTPVTFDTTVSGGPLVCTAASGSADLTAVEMRTFQSLLVLNALRFSQPLPWTPLTLGDWFSHAIRGVKISNLPFGTGGFCCNPAGVIVVGNPGLLDITRFADPVRNWNGPVQALLETLVHEARHAEGPLHQCPPDDNTISEYGAWGVQYGFNAWVALFSGSFMTSPDTHPAAYRDTALNRAGVWRQHGCLSAFADLELRARDTPDPVVSGGTLTHSATVTNAGPGQADGVLFYEEVPAGARVTSVNTGQGACTPPAEANFGAIGCRLGSLAVGASTKVTIKFKITARAGTVLRNATRETQGFLPGAVAISEEREPRTDRARANHIVALQTTVKAKPKPKKKKKKPRR